MDSDLAERRGDVDARLDAIETKQDELYARVSQNEKRIQQSIGALKAISAILGTGVLGIILSMLGIL